MFKVLTDSIEFAILFWDTQHNFVNLFFLILKSGK